MESVVEQVVKSNHYAEERKRSRFLLILMIAFFVIFILLECFGLTVSQVYYYTDRELFRSFMLFFALSALPIIIMEAILYLLRRRLCVAFDYYYDGTQFKIIRTVNEKKKKLVAVFTNDAIRDIGRVDSEGYLRAFPPDEKRKPLICALNIDNPNIYYVKTEAYLEGVPRECVIVLEPKRELVSLLYFSCPHVPFTAANAWNENIG